MTAEARSGSLAGYTGLFGMKGTFGRMSRGPARSRPSTVVNGCLARSGARRISLRRLRRRRPRDPTSPPDPGGWERNSASTELKGRKVAILPSIAGVPLEAGVEDEIRAFEPRIWSR